MRFRLFIVIALVCFTTALRADTVTGNVTGVITIQGPGPYIDYYGLFGPVGASLTGDQIAIQYTYNTADFQNAPGVCASHCASYFSTAVSPAESISVTVNGQTHSYTPNFYSKLEFQSAYYFNNPAYFTEDVDAGINGASIRLYSPNDVTFGQPVTTAGGMGLDTVYFYGAAGTQAIGFTPSTPSPAPEPSSILLVGTGLLGMAGILKRRFSKAHASQSTIC